MAIQTTIARHYAWRCIIIAAVCLVLGVWGVYDYVWKIPSRLQAHERGDVAAAVRDAMLPGAEQQTVTDARELLEEARRQFAERYGPFDFSAVAPLSDEDEAIELGREVREIVNLFNAKQQEPWARAIAVFEHGLDAGRVPEGQTLTQRQFFAYEVAERTVEGASRVPRPRAHDRPVQWMFILCLPFVPIYLWEFFKQKSRTYRLDDDGTLHTPSGTLSQNQIKDIHMDRWMAKSIAYLEHADGTRIKLDDYKQKDLHLIIGAIASKRYPEQWDEQAKPVKKDSESAEGAATAEGSVAAEQTSS